jgi:hypothetical protein
VALGVETLNDLETKVISVVIVIMGVHFLEHFIQWQDPMITLQHAASLGIVVAALVFFKIFAHREAVETKRRRPGAVARAKIEMFEHAHEEQDVVPAEREVARDAERERGRRSDDGERGDAAKP